jgi:heterodisulfide reductase subunit C
VAAWKNNSLMKDFGYTVGKDRQVDYDTHERRVLDYLKEWEPSVNQCIACGSCTATCSAGRMTDFNIRAVHTYLRRGMVHNLRNEIKKCMFCGKCQLVCPRGVNMRNLILQLHNAIERLGI